ncbi:NUDIX hydrolase [Nocardioides acrostichi]|uniref:NUDIX domain-containing protein n=1 Tax=Nocardioides acrostichi TaxID=2784339 RepID=A0A930V1Z9_9ACTN|nr:NUDIX domain-containing protein [Nocardioides acrostichi]MBF4162569.1 NUDIX domain-containing protein [Nocardioides acrostichi]
MPSSASADGSGTTAAVVTAAGAVVVRKGREVLLVHRPRYDDWSFPKGKVDPGEHPVATAVREVEEETGVRVRLGAPLPILRYPTGPAGSGRTKVVHYWHARTLGDDHAATDVSGYEPNKEIDDVRWVGFDTAGDLLSYERDRELLAEAVGSHRRSHPLVVLRHAEARPRKSWRGADQRRPLGRDGTVQARTLVPLLAAYDARRVLTSPSLRCLETVAPWAAAADLEPDLRPCLSEEDVDPAAIVGLVEELVAGVRGDRGGAVLCSHRPVLPEVFAALGLPDPRLAPGEMLVAHLRKGQVVATEQHHSS